jgi:ADP-heptose:LPS heptosyltransferase
VLFIRFSSLGDTILTTGIIASLSGLQVKPDILTYAEFADVWRGLVPEGNIHTIKRGISLREYIKQLKALPKFDEIFDLHANTRTLIARFFLKGRFRRYNKQSLARRLFVKWRLCRSRLTKHTVERYAEAVFGDEIPSLEALRPCLQPLSRASSGNKVVLHPFASKISKEWGGFEALAERLTALGYEVVVVGKGFFNGVETKSTTLTDLFETMASAALVISTDSGPLHAAVALNRPVLAIFCSTTEELGFYPKFTNCEVIERAEVKCRPCHVHGQNTCPQGDWACKAISVDSVLEAACRMIQP